MVDVSPEQAANFFHTVEVNLSQTTAIAIHVGHMPSTAKVHAIDAKPKAKAAAATDGPKAASPPSSPVKSDGPAPPKRPALSVSSRSENPVKGKGKGDTDGADKPGLYKKGQLQLWPYSGH